ncbi:MAG: peptidoglycan-binding protein [Bacillota bacterium]
MGPYTRRLAGRLALVALIVLAGLACTSAVSAHRLSSPLKIGMKGENVRALQEMLKALGFAAGDCDGVFGQDTLRAVKAFQKLRGLGVDGIVGAATWERLEAEVRSTHTKVYVVRSGDTLSEIARKFGVSVQDLARANGISNASSIKIGQELRVPSARSAPSRGERPLVEVLSWEEARRVFKTTARVIDVRTGLSFQVKRRGGHFHADCEPITVEDTATMKQVFGGQWSWERRPIIVEIGGRRVAASMNGMPHGGQWVRNNGFPGHFCIHFAGSRLHGSGSVDLEHQACVREAAGLR